MLDVNRTLEGPSMEKRRTHISSKRQITIPAKYFDALGLSKEVTASMQTTC